MSGSYIKYIRKVNYTFKSHFFNCLCKNMNLHKHPQPNCNTNKNILCIAHGNTCIA